MNYISIDFDKSIYYIPLDGCEPIEIGIEDFFPKPSPLICIKGIAKKFPLKDIEGELKRNLEHGETESDDDTAKVGIVDVRREDGGALVASSHCEKSFKKDNLHVPL